MDSEILDRLISAGKITPDDIKEVSATIVTPEKEEIIEGLHLIFCDGDHDGVCMWYTEKQMADTWQQDAHTRWLTYYITLAQKVEGDEDDMKLLIASLNRLLRMEHNGTAVDWLEHTCKAITETFRGAP